MRYFIDTEFYEQPLTGAAGRIDLISIGIVDQSGREYYAENAHFDWNVVLSQAGQGVETPKWLLENVKPHLSETPETFRIPARIKDEILLFVGADDRPEFWGYFADYDWVVFCWIFGRMMDLPHQFPKYCMDLKQLMKQFGVPRERLPHQLSGEHNALADAKWNREVYSFILAQWGDQ